MKKNKMLFFALLAIAALAVAACEEQPAPPPINGVTPALSEFNAYYEDGVLYYSAVIDKPTPCHEVIIDESPGSITNIDFAISMPDTDEICAQVITPEEISGSIEMEKPDTIIVFLDGVLVHEEPDVEERDLNGNGVPPISEDGFAAWYEDGLLRYSARIEKPTPCYELNVEEMVMESFPVKIRVDVEIYNPDPEQMCIQVVEVVELQGSIEIDHVPASFSLFIDGEEMYATSEIPEI